MSFGAIFHLVFMLRRLYSGFTVPVGEIYLESIDIVVPVPVYSSLKETCKQAHKREDGNVGGDQLELPCLVILITRY
jgi:hypothetical protein